MADTSRIYAMDSLRAIMIMLGIVLHAALTYGTIDYSPGWPIKDPNSTHLTNDIIFFTIHSFRMQIFFIVAGFFGAMLFYERGIKMMLKNRFNRIVLPFIAALIILYPISMLSASYALVKFNEPSAAVYINDLLETGMIFVPTSTGHLWFLYYLIFITAFVTLLAMALQNKRTITQPLTQLFELVFQRPVLRVLVWTSLVASLCWLLGMNRVVTSTSLIVNTDTFLYYSVFYLFGWVLYRSKHLLPLFKKQDYFWTIMGLVFALIYLFNFTGTHYSIQAAFGAAIVWSFVFGIIGLFIRFADKKSAIWRYLSDASYWVYLIHLPFTLYIPGLIAGWPVPAFGKFLIVAITTTIFSFATYHWFVRATFIGLFLNGRKYPRQIHLPH